MAKLTTNPVVLQHHERALLILLVELGVQERLEDE
jgi:hypothetical protein